MLIPLVAAGRRESMNTVFRAEVAPGCQLPKHASSHLCAISVCVMLGAETGLGKHCGCENNKMNASQFCFN